MSSSAIQKRAELNCCEEMTLYLGTWPFNRFETALKPSYYVSVRPREGCCSLHRSGFGFVFVCFYFILYWSVVD